MFLTFFSMRERREITIYNNAKHLNISATTVSRGLKDNPAISKTTRRKIADAASLLEYRSNLFASNLRRQKTRITGVIIPRINSHFMASVLTGMDDIAGKKGYTLIINHADENAEKNSPMRKPFLKNGWTAC